MGLLSSVLKKALPFAVAAIPGIGPIASAALTVGGSAAIGAALGKKKGKGGSSESTYTPVPKDPIFSAKLADPKGLFADLAAKPSGMTPEDYLTYGRITRKPDGGFTVGKTGAQFFDYAKSPEEQQLDLAVKPSTPAASTEFDWNAYLAANPDIMAEFQEESTRDKKSINNLKKIGATTAVDYAKWHANNYGLRGPPPPTAPAVPVAPNDLAVQPVAAPAVDPALVVAPPVVDPALAVSGSAIGHPDIRVFKKGGGVRGKGSGRSDEIEALLSDGEYVIDAETVALLGDGSSKAGAKRLDDFRVNIRKQKGAKLAKGEFSANAKRPEKYMTGGKV